MEAQVALLLLLAMDMELVAKVCFVEDHEGGITNENLCFEHEVAVLNADREPWKAFEFVDNCVSKDTAMKLPNMQEVMLAVEERASAQRLLVFWTVEDSNSARDQF